MRIKRKVLNQHKTQLIERITKIVNSSDDDLREQVVRAINSNASIDSLSRNTMLAILLHEGVYLAFPNHWFNPPGRG